MIDEELGLEEFIRQAQPRSGRGVGSVIDSILDECDVQWRETLLGMLHDPSVPDVRLGAAIAKKFGRGSPDSVARWREREGVER